MWTTLTVKPRLQHNVRTNDNSTTGTSKSMYLSIYLSVSQSMYIYLPMNIHLSIYYGYLSIVYTITYLLTCTDTYFLRSFATQIAAFILGLFENGFFEVGLQREMSEDAIAMVSENPAFLTYGRVLAISIRQTRFSRTLEQAVALSRVREFSF